MRPRTPIDFSWITLGSFRDTLDDAVTDGIWIYLDAEFNPLECELRDLLGDEVLDAIEEA
jgi:hypothetical protein